MAGMLVNITSPHCCKSLSGSSRLCHSNSSPAVLLQRSTCLIRHSIHVRSTGRSCGRRHAGVHSSSRANAGPTAQQEADRTAGRETYRPPSFQTLIDDASKSILMGMDDGLTRMEVELPSVGVDSELDSHPRLLLLLLRVRSSSWCI